MTIQLRLSGGASNALSAGSLGGQMSSTVVTSDVLENVFDNLSRSEVLLGRTEYRCLYVYNAGATTVYGVTIELTTNPTVSQLGLGLDLVGKGNGSTTGVAQSIAAEDITPTGLRYFSEATATNDGPYLTVVLPIGILKTGECVAFWLKRVSESGFNAPVTANLAITYSSGGLPVESSTVLTDGGAIGELIKLEVLTAPFYISTARIGFSEMSAP